MKLKLYYSLISILILLLSSCTSQKVENLQDIVKDINFMCPLNEGAGDMLSVDYDKLSNTVTMELAADSRFTDIEKLREHRDLQIDCLRLSLHDSSASRLLKAMVAAEATLNIIYTNQSNGQTVNFRIEPAELKEELDKQITWFQRDSIETDARIALENAMCPREIGPGIFLNGVDITGGNILYIYNIDSDFKGKNLQNEKDSIEHAIYNNINDLLSHHRRGRELRQVAQLGYGIVYIYNIEKLDKQIDIVVTGDTLKQLVEKNRVNHRHELR